MAYLDTATPPAFVSLTDEARAYESDDADVVYSSVHPESVNTVDIGVRDRWIVSAAEATLRRVTMFDEALSMPYHGDDLTRALEARGTDSTLTAGVPRAIDHYGTTRTYLKVPHGVAVRALELITGDRDQVGPLNVTPDDGGDAVLNPLPELDLEPAASVGIEVGEASAGEVGADAGGFENESGSEPTATLDSEPEFDDGAESKAVGPESESGSIVEPDSRPESASNPESVTTKTTAAAGSQPGASESEPASEPSTTVDSEPEPEPTAEPEPEPAAEPGLTSEPEPRPVTDSLDTESKPDFNDGTLGGSEGDAPDAGATDTGSPGNSRSGTLNDFGGGFDDPDPEADDSTGSTDSVFAGTDDSVDPDGMYGLDEDERAEVEFEFDTEFTSGADVDPAGETDIDMPDADDPTEQLEDESAATAESDPEPATTAAEPGPAVDLKPEPTSNAASDGDEGEANADPDADESAKGIDLEPVVVGAMDDLGDGDGTTRSEVVVAVVDRHGADLGAVEGAIQEVLLDGRCYEPRDGVLEAI